MSQTVVANSNVDLDEHVEAEIATCLDLESPRSFFLYAGAGSGKTSSLIKALEFLKEKNFTRLRLRGQKVAVITYTNAACDEITRRIKFDHTFHVSTIHSFAWKLIGGFNRDIKDWLRKKLQEEISEITELEAKGRAGTKASATRLAQIESKNRRLQRLGEIKKFTYNPSGDNKERDSLNHSEVLEICASFLSAKPLMQSVLVNQYPFLLVDESQDTNKRIVDALLAVQATHSNQFSLGFIGDTMQRIYTDGKERIEEELPPDWARPAKRLNHRCPKRIVRLINQIRGHVDEHTQEARSDSVDGLLRLFVFHTTVVDKPMLEDAVRVHMAKLTGDSDWNKREKCKILTLEHHMAAKRMGFATLFEALSKVDDFRTGLLDGTLPATRLFTSNILPLVTAQQREDKFAAAKVVRSFSPLLNAQAIKDASDQREQLRKARNAVEELMKIWETGEPTCGAVLAKVAETGLFSLPESLKPLVIRKQFPEMEKADAEAERQDPVAEEIIALEAFLAAPFSEIAPYARYVSDTAEFGTHQGVKGLEFDRVMVLMDDAEARGFMFGYDKLFGAKEMTPTDTRNEVEGRDSSLARTRRLFYVTCSRAKKSLALIVYSPAPTSVRNQMIENGWFDDNEIVLALPS